MSVGYFSETFPIRVTWLPSIFMFVGGGPFVCAAVTAALVAKIVEKHSGTTTGLNSRQPGY